MLSGFTLRAWNSRKTLPPAYGISWKPRPGLSHSRWRWWHMLNFVNIEFLKQTVCSGGACAIPSLYKSPSFFLLNLSCEAPYVWWECERRQVNPTKSKLEYWLAMARMVIHPINGIVAFVGWRKVQLWMPPTKPISPIFGAPKQEEAFVKGFADDTEDDTFVLCWEVVGVFLGVQ